MAASIERMRLTGRRGDPRMLPEHLAPDGDQPVDRIDAGAVKPIGFDLCRIFYQLGIGVRVRLRAPTPPWRTGAADAGIAGNSRLQTRRCPSFLRATFQAARVSHLAGA